MVTQVIRKRWVMIIRRNPYWNYSFMLSFLQSHQSEVVEKNLNFFFYCIWLSPLHHIFLSGWLREFQYLNRLWSRCWCWRSQRMTVRGRRVCELCVCARWWVLPGRWLFRSSEGGGPVQDSAARLGATWSAWFFPTFPSLHALMNGFLLVCGRSPT